MTYDAREAALREMLRAHQPRTVREQRSLRRIEAMVDWLGLPFDQESDPTHLTASAIVVDDTHERVLLHRHKSLHRWMQPGGHIDDGEEPAVAARREVAEETGLDAHHPDGPRLVHVDVHEAGRGHLHLDLRFLLLADGGAPLTPGPGESRDVAWFGANEARGLADASAVAAINSAFASLRAIGLPTS